MQAYAKAGGKADALKPLRETLIESKVGDELFHKITDEIVNPAAAKAA